MTDPTVVACYWQRLTPPFSSEPVDAWLSVYQNAVVLELDGGDRIVVDRDDLAEAITRPPLRAA